MRWGRSIANESLESKQTSKNFENSRKFSFRRMQAKPVSLLVVLEPFNHLDEAFSFACDNLFRSGHFDKDCIASVEF